VPSLFKYPAYGFRNAVVGEKLHHPPSSLSSHPHATPNCPDVFDS
jgi:hypothetical protein